MASIIRREAVTRPLVRNQRMAGGKSERSAALFQRPGFFRPGRFFWHELCYYLKESYELRNDKKREELGIHLD